MTNSEWNNQEDNKNSSDQKQIFRVIEDGNTLKNKEEINTGPVYVRPRAKRRNYWTPVILTILSACIIGTILGIAMLELFVGVAEEQPEEQPIPTPTETEQTTSPVEEPPLVELSVLSAHVIQAGLFTERENVETWSKQYQDIGEPTFIWEEDGQFYLFIGIYSTAEEAKSKVEELQSEGHDVFTKPWVTSEIHEGFTGEELEWLDKFYSAWQHSLTERNIAPLEQLFDVAPPSNRLNILSESISQSQSFDIYLLELMYIFENL